MAEQTLVWQRPWCSAGDTVMSVCQDWLSPALPRPSQNGELPQGLCPRAQWAHHAPWRERERTKSSFAPYCSVQAGSQPCLGLPIMWSLFLLSSTLNQVIRTAIGFQVLFPEKLKSVALIYAYIPEWNKYIHTHAPLSEERLEHSRKAPFSQTWQRHNTHSPQQGPCCCSAYLWPVFLLLRQICLK